LKDVRNKADYACVTSQRIIDSPADFQNDANPSLVSEKVARGVYTILAQSYPLYSE